MRAAPAIAAKKSPGTMRLAAEAEGNRIFDNAVLTEFVGPFQA
jgi:hypothetical protein